MGRFKRFVAREGAIIFIFVGAVAIFISLDIYPLAESFVLLYFAISMIRVFIWCVKTGYPELWDRGTRIKTKGH